MHLLTGMFLCPQWRASSVAQCCKAVSQQSSGAESVVAMDWCLVFFSQSL